MSLVPYSFGDSHEIVLRHGDAIVLRDPVSKQLVLRAAPPPLPDCPYCHRPFHPESPGDRQRENRPSPTHNDSFVSPEYFRLLHLSNEEHQGHSPPSSPIRRLTQPAFPFPSGSSPNGSSSVGDAEFLASTPAAASRRTGNSIKKDAFSQGYFKKFLIKEKELGSGGKGVVWLVRHELDGIPLGHFACKRVPVGDDHNWLVKALTEVSLLQQLSHPNLVSYCHAWLEEVGMNRFGPPVICVFILQQYCNAGDLLHYVAGSKPPTNTKEELKAKARRRSKGQSERPDFRSARKLTIDEIASFFKDIVAGLAYLHAANYIHRDLKPSNCLLNRHGNDLRCLISDFGEVQAENVVRKSTGSTGTISYCAPEVLRKDASGSYGNFTTKSDIFSLGMILYFMCFGRLPYTSAENIQEEFEDLDQLRSEISEWSGFREKKERPDLPDQLYTFLKKLLALDPNERPSAAEVLQAINTGKGLKMESPSRNGRVGSGLGPSSASTRIHSLDSPMPGTPLPDNRRTISSAYAEDIPESTSAPLIPRKEPTPPVPPGTPLLLPPPSTSFTRFQVFLNNTQHSISHWAELNHYELTLLLKSILFLCKVASITRPCLPLATKPWVVYTLMGLAALDLSFRNSWRIMVVLLAMHVLGVWGAWVSGGLCVGQAWWDGPGL